ncbi:MAG: hypothetical protein ABI823_08850 [Bryobacteraceae bacterium]
MIKMILLIAVCAASLAAADGERKCTTGSLRGDYAFVVNGTRPSGPPPAEIEQFVGLTRRTFDGYGGATQTDYTRGTISGGSTRSGTATYSINEDCTGTMTVINNGAPPLEARIVIVDGGKEVWLMITSPSNIFVTAIGKRI